VRALGVLLLLLAGCASHGRVVSVGVFKQGKGAVMAPDEVWTVWHVVSGALARAEKDEDGTERFVQRAHVRVGPRRWVRATITRVEAEPEPLARLKLDEPVFDDDEVFSLRPGSDTGVPIVDPEWTYGDSGTPVVDGRGQLLGLLKGWSRRGRDAVYVAVPIDLRPEAEGQ